jgi:acyl-CoA oxidase
VAELIPRICLAAAKSGLTIARYSDHGQFGPEGGSEVPILNYRIHQRRLLPLLAKTYATHFVLQYVTNRLLIKVNLKCQKLKPLLQV